MFAYLLGMITFMIILMVIETLTDLILKNEKMKNKIGFNLVFAILAFPIGLALLKEFDFNTFTFKKTALGILYLVTFILCVFLTFKKKRQQSNK